MITSTDTRMHIAKCLNTLLKKKPIDRLSVVEVCQSAGVSRTTFYKYFQDIYSVPEWLWEYAFSDILGQIGLKYGWSEGHRVLFETMAELKECVLYTESDRMTNSFLLKANSLTLQIHTRNIEAKRGYPLTEQEAVELNYLSYMHASMTHKWISDGMRVSPALMQKIIADLVPPLIADTLGR